MIVRLLHGVSDIHNIRIFLIERLETASTPLFRSCDDALADELLLGVGGGHIRSGGIGNGIRVVGLCVEFYGSQGLSDLTIIFIAPCLRVGLIGRLIGSRSRFDRLFVSIASGGCERLNSFQIID